MGRSLCARPSSSTYRWNSECPPPPSPPSATCCHFPSPSRNSGCSPPPQRPPIARCRSRHAHNTSAPPRSHPTSTWGDMQRDNAMSPADSPHAMPHRGRDCGVSAPSYPYLPLTHGSRRVQRHPPLPTSHMLPSSHHPTIFSFPFGHNSLAPLLLPSRSRVSSPNNFFPLHLWAPSPPPPPLHPSFPLRLSSVFLSPLSPSLPLQRVSPSSTRVLPYSHRYRLTRLGSCLPPHPFPWSPPLAPPSSTLIPLAHLSPSSLLCLVLSVPSGFSPATPN
jgi:hypothetical protein